GRHLRLPHTAVVHLAGSVHGVLVGGLVVADPLVVVHRRSGFGVAPRRREPVVGVSGVTVLHRHRQRAFHGGEDGAAGGLQPAGRRVGAGGRGRHLLGLTTGGADLVIGGLSGGGQQSTLDDLGVR